MAKAKNAQPDILNLLRHSGKRGDEPGTVTTPEIKKLLGCGARVARSTAEDLVEAGKLEKAMVLRNSGWGVTQPVKGFRIV